MADGLLAVFSICSALLSRELGNSGGEYLDVALTDAVVSFSQVIAPEPPAGGDAAHRRVPWYDVYEAADGGSVTIGTLEPQFRTAFCERSTGRTSPVST